MITIKSGVQFTVLRREIWTILSTIEETFPKGSCMVTCGNEGHGPDDPHTHGFALDFRSRGLPGDNIATNLRVSLGPKYTVLFEDPGGPNEHIHIQVRKDLWRSLI